MEVLEACRHTGFIDMARESGTFERVKVPW